MLVSHILCVLSPFHYLVSHRKSDEAEAVSRKENEDAGESREREGINSEQAAEAEDEEEGKPAVVYVQATRFDKLSTDTTNNQSQFSMGGLSKTGNTYPDEYNIALFQPNIVLAAKSEQASYESSSLRLGNSASLSKTGVQSSVLQLEEPLKSATIQPKPKLEEVEERGGGREREGERGVGAERARGRQADKTEEERAAERPQLPTGGYDGEWKDTPKPNKHTYLAHMYTHTYTIHTHMHARAAQAAILLW